MTNHDQKLLWLRLALTPALGPRTLWKLYKRFKTPENILNASPEELVKLPGIRRSTLYNLTRNRTVRNPEAEFDVLKSKNLEFITWEDENYPPLLRHIPDPPLFLFVKGNYSEQDTLAIAVVGTRYPTPQGRLIAERLAYDLASLGITVVSGLAIGIDTSAHRGALKAGGRTIAVLGCGTDVPYPKSNVHLKERIASQGALVTEYPLGTMPEKWRFPLRNRIISGLSLGVVVVEAGLKSGALITARLAADQGREVFAVPGSAMDYRTAGTNSLLKAGAKLVEKVDDIIEEIEAFKNIRNQASSHRHSVLTQNFTELEKSIMNNLTDKPQHVDILCRKIDCSMKELLVALSALEMKGLVRQLPGKHFILEKRVIQ
ncbi:MAG: DNA-protecting protein DprA [Deltaproteobacteria bacterium]|nr:DNA-protecting protein DprA [Deltaproteobacteria bacterium]MBW2069158.1 DNA-protecting protein DprA [Deltaproteobacteria bacterium]